jgi:hypothetical protein
MKNGMYFELDGKVNLIEVTGGKTKSSEIDGELVLRVLLAALETGLSLYESKTKAAKKPRSNRSAPSKQRRTNQGPKKGSKQKGV